MVVVGEKSDSGRESRNKRLTVMDERGVEVHVARSGVATRVVREVPESGSEGSAEESATDCRSGVVGRMTGSQQAASVTPGPYNLATRMKRR